ncbi:MAG: hypothetical protein ACMVO3_22800 [Thalassobaculum sp.]
MTEVKTPRQVLDALTRASKHTMTAEEIGRQRVSFIMGSLEPESNVTREGVEKILAKHEGRVAV